GDRPGDGDECGDGGNELVKIALSGKGDRKMLAMGRRYLIEDHRQSLKTLVGSHLPQHQKSERPSCFDIRRYTLGPLRIGQEGQMWHHMRRSPRDSLRVGRQLPGVND